MPYTTSLVRKLLSDYQRRAQGARMRAPEDRLVTRPPPLHEAPWAATSCMWADIERAMQNLPFRDAQILWMTVCLGEASWRNGTKRYDWRRRVAGWWGRGGYGDERPGWMTPGGFRFGASSMANDVLMQLVKQSTGIYQSADYFSKD